ncbi:MAG: MBL fold metallo-hydrolase [Solirubrobacterales bacterium]|nr:MBL fold metallo-hydrolase [Solirubrobacterales bacterium]
MKESGGTLKGERTPTGEVASFDGGLVEVATGAWAWIQPNGGLGESNAGLIVGAGESLLIDTLWDARLTETMLAATEPVTAAAGAPIRTLLNTHGDGDHWYGNGLLSPDVEIVASDAAIEQMRTEPPSMLTRLAPVGTAAGLVGRVPLFPGGSQLRGLAAFGSALDAYEFGDLHPRMPVRGFSGSRGLEIGGRRVEVIEVGPAHTTGDAIAWLADARVVFAGDIVFNGVTPIMWAGPAANWIAALERIELLEPDVVVGGHGPVTGIEEVRTLRDYWSWLAEGVGAAPGEDPAELAERLVRSNEFKTAPWGRWRNPERTLVNVARIAATEAGAPCEVGTVERIRLIAGMGALAERLRG